MRKNLTLSFRICAALAVAAGCGGRTDGGVDLILTGGQIWPDVRSPLPVTAIAISGDRVVITGDDATVRALAGESTQEMPLEGATVLPGLADAWVDVEALGRWPETLDVSRAATPRELQAMLRGASADADGWIVGWGWDETRWPARTLPDSALLDAAEPERPVLLYRRAGRLAVANSAALRSLGLADDGVGRITDPRLATVEAARPASDEDRRRWWITGLQRLAAAGVTRAATSPVAPDTWDLLRRLLRDGDLLIRLDVRLQPPATVDASDAAPGDALLRWAGYGLELDGPFAPPMAWLGDDDVDPTAGARLQDACRLAASSGQPLAVHAQGDLAVAAASTCPGIADGTGLLVGADVLPEQGLPAGTRVAVVPGRLAHDLYFLDGALGPDRSARAHRYRDLADAGHLAGIASVAPSYALDPLEAVRVMLERRDADGYPLDGWFPQQRLAVIDSLPAALRSGNGAAARLDPGSPADLVIWSEDPLGDPLGLSRALPMMTMVAGRVIYSRPWLAPESAP